MDKGITGDLGITIGMDVSDRFTCIARCQGRTETCSQEGAVRNVRTGRNVQQAL